MSFPARGHRAGEPRTDRGEGVSVMTVTVARPELAARCAQVLRAHPAIADAFVAEDELGRTLAWFVPDRHSGRVPATGSCSLIDEGGAEFSGELVDVSFDGIRVRCAEAPPEVGALVQMVIESPALGGVDGRLGRVRWRRGHEAGVNFEGNFDDAHGLVRFVQAFVEAANGPSPEGPQISPQTRVRCELACMVDLGSAGSCAGRTVDVSAAGLLVELALTPTVDWRDQKLTVSLDVPGAPSLRGTVLRQSGRRFGICLLPDEAASRFLCDLVTACVRDNAVSQSTLHAWLRAHGLGGVTSFCAVESIARDARGVVDPAALPRH